MFTNLKFIRNSLEIITFSFLVIVPTIMLIYYITDVWNFINSFLWDTGRGSLQCFVCGDDPYTDRWNSFKLWWLNLFAFIINVVLIILYIVTPILIGLIIYTIIIITIDKLIKKYGSRKS